ncbi:MAG: hypothetical protein JWP04_1114 [Belnapia sp.]|nr:hypothetical protein [Belnapia sp.]
MNVASGAGAPHERFAAGRLLALAGLLAALGGCAALQSGAAPGDMAPVEAVQPMDAVASFAASARPGAESVILVPETGRNTRVRLMRAYNAASGRECREVLIGTGGEERSRLVCQVGGQAGGSQWADARPLLRGGGSQRP